MDPLTVATWNLNSVRARLERLLRWLAARRPDVVCLQELKVEEGSFPFDELRAVGYHAAVFGQKTYNGVAILSRTEAEDVVRGLDDEVDDPQARLVSARIQGVRVLSAYFPNGQNLVSDRYRYKLEWMKRLRRHLDRRHSPQELLVLCGDYNVAPEPRDVYDPAAWEGTVLFHPEVRGALEEIRSFGLVDVFRLHHQEGGLYSWWDYRMLAFPKRRGLRIDHLYATEPLARRCREALIDRDERKGKQPSDHAPVLARFDLS